MAFEQDFPPFTEWLLNNLLINFPVILGTVAVAFFLLGFLIAAYRRGPVEGFYAVAKVIAAGVTDLIHWSPRRTIAMARLAVQEAIRRRVLIAFAVFVVVMLFAGWYLDVRSENPARLYLSFVLTASNYLVLSLALLLSVFSLPADIKSRTIYTVMTKPVRPLEIILGRIVGFGAVGTVLLFSMCIVSYFFVVRGLSHQHRAEVGGVVKSETEDGVWEGETTFDAHHRHTFRVNEEGVGDTDVVMGHWHTVTRIGEGDDAEYEIGPPEEALQARVPIFGRLTFLNREGQPTRSGINVGTEWQYRSYIEGGTFAAAVWEFEGLTPERYPDGLNLEMNLRVFRTHKGDVEKGVLGTMVLVNPDPNSNLRGTEKMNFMAKEFTIDRRTIPRNLRVIDKEGVVQDADLFDLVDDEGRLEVWVRCEEHGQYYGMAERDVYILDSELPFWMNFAKGYIGIWLQMVLVISFGVMFSTFLSGPVAMMASLSSIVIGYFGSFITGLASGTYDGGGPIEAFIRILKQLNLQVDIEAGTVATSVVRSLDFVFVKMVQTFSHLVPDYTQFDTVEFVASGYSIGGDVLGMHAISALGYFLVVSVVAYFLLKTREVAA